LKAPNRKRPLPKKLCRGFSKAQLDRLVKKVSYVGSPEHKDQPNRLIPAEQHKPRANASICPRWITEKKKVERWLRKAIRKGAIGELMENGFPRYVWYLDKKHETVYIGRLVNRATGQYKGWPIEKFEWPKEIEQLYE